MDADNGTLFFDADIDDSKYNAKILAMIQKGDLLHDSILSGNADIQASYAMLAGTLGGSTIQKSFTDFSKSVNDPEIKAGIDEITTNVVTMSKKAVDAAAKAQAAIDKLKAKGGYGDSTAEAFSANNFSEPSIPVGPVISSGQQALIASFNAEFEAGIISATKLKELIDQISISNAEWAATTETVVKATGDELGRIEKLEIAIADLKALKPTLIPVADIEAANLKIAQMTLQLKTLNSIGTETFTQVDKAVQKPIGTFNRLTYAAGLYEQMSKNSTNPDIISKYNAKLQDAQVQLGQISNVGKKGFDDVGNAAAKSTNIFSSVWSSIRKIAYILPGVGIAGIIAFATEPIVKYLATLDLFGTKLNLLTQTLRDRLTVQTALNDVTVSAAKSAQTELVTANELYKASQNRNLSIKDQTDAATQLQNLYPTTLGNFTAEAILAGKAAGAYKELRTEILDLAYAKSISDKIGTNSTRKLQDDLDITKEQTEQIRLQRVAAKAKADPQNKLAIGSDFTAENYAIILTAQKDYNDSKKRENQLISDRILLDKEDSSLEDRMDNLVKKRGTKALTGGTAPVSKENQDLIESQKIQVQSDLDTQNAISDDREKSLAQRKDALKKALNDELSLIELNANQELLNTNLTSLQKKNILDKENADKLKAKSDYQKKADNLDKSASTQGNELQNAGDALVKQEADIQQKISQLRQKYANQGLGKDDAERQAIITEFQQYNFEITKANKAYDDFVKKFGKNAVATYNANPKNTVKLQKVDPNSLQGVQQQALDDLTAKQTVTKTQVMTEQLKQIYKEYADYKLKYGTDQANAEYSSELQGFTNYVDFIKDQIKNLQVKVAINTGTGQSNATNNALLDFYNKELPKAQNDQQNQYFQNNITNLSRILDATKTYLNTVKDINLQYDKDVLRITYGNFVADAAARLRVLKQNRDIALDGAKTLAFQESQVGIDAAKNLFNLTKQQLDEQIAILKADLKNGFTTDASGNTSALTPAQRKQVQAALDAAQGLKTATDPTVKAFTEISTYANDAASGFEGLSSAVKDVNPGLADTLDAMSQIASMASQVATLFANIGSGNIAGIISSTISLLVSVVTYAFRGKASAIESAKELLAYNNSLLDSQVAYNELLRDQQRTQDDITKLTIAELNAREQMLATQKDQAQADYNAQLTQIQATGQQITGEHTQKYGGFLGIGQKTKVVQDTSGVSGLDYDSLLKLYTEGKLTDQTKTWFEALQKVHDEFTTIDDDTQATADQLDQLLTGTTADSISSAIIDGFKAGKRTAADFADTFQSLMQSAALSVFQSSYLNDKIAGFYKSFADASNSAGGLTDAKIQELKDQYNQIITDGASQIAQIEKITGTSLTDTGADSNSLSGAIQANITEDTANILAGLFRGFYEQSKQTFGITQDGNVTLKQQLTIMTQSLAIQTQISTNTLRSAVSNDSIDSNIKALLKAVATPANALTANGR